MITEWKDKLVEFYITDIDSRDYPDFCDACVTDCFWYETGVDLTEKETEEFNEYANSIGLINETIHEEQLWM